MADAGLRLVVEGEKEFKKALADIDAQIKSNKKELQLLAEQYKVEDDGLGNLTERQKVLAESYAAQAEKVALLKEKRAEAASSLGEEDRQTVALTNAVQDAETALARMAAQQEANNKMIEDAKYSVSEYDATIEQMRATIDANASEIKGMGAEMDKLGDSADGLRGKNESLSKQNDVLRKSMDAQRSVIDSLNSEYKVAVQRYGEGSAEAEKYRKKVLDATAELGRMEDKLGENEQAIRGNSKALEEGGKAPNAILEKLQKVSDMTGIEIPDGIKKMIGGFDDSAIAVTGITTALVGVAKKVTDVYKETMEWADEITEQSQELDLGAEEYQALEYALAKIGVEMDTYADAIKEINNKAGEASKKTAEYAKEEIAAEEEMIAAKEELLREYYANYPKWEDHKNEDMIKVFETYEREYEKNLKKINEDYANTVEKIKQKTADATQVFDDIGVSIFDANGELRSSQEIMEEAIESFSNMTQGVERSKAMMDLFGESARKLNPLVEAGTKMFEKFKQEAYDTGVVLEDELTAKLDAASASFDSLGMKIESASRRFVAEDSLFKRLLNGELISQALEELGALFSGNYDLYDKSYWKNRAYATGTYNHPGGLAIVGENGPEIVDLPRGSKVYPNGTAPDGMGGGVYIGSITIPASDIREFNDIIDIVQGAATGFRRG